MLTPLLYTNTYYEIVMTLVLISFPTLLLPFANETTLLVSRSFGVASLIISVLSFTLIRTNEKHFLLSGIVILAIFHVAMTISQIINSIQYASPIPVALIHGIFGILFIIQGIKHAE